MTDTMHTIAASARQFFSGTLLSRFSGFLRDVATAAAFGTSPEIAAFMLAFRLSQLMRRLFGEGALQTAFIPQFEKARAENPAKGMQFYMDLWVALTLLLSVLIGVGMGLLSFLSPSFSPENRQIADLTIAMLPSLLFICLYGLNTALLQCNKHYFISSLAPLFFNLTWMAALSLSSSVYTLAIMINAACCLQWLATMPQTMQMLSPFWSKIHWRWQPMKIASFYKPFAFSFIGVMAVQVNSAVDFFFARAADPSGPALLWYAIRLQQLPLALFGIAASSALLPPLARAAERQDFTKLHFFFWNAFKRCCAWALPCTLLLMLFGSDLVRIVYQRGDFSEAAVMATTWCLWGYALGLFPSAAILLVAPVFYAQKNYQLPMAASLVSIGSNIALNSLFIIGFGFGPASVALATSLSAGLNLIVLGKNLAIKKVPPEQVG